MLKFGFLSSEVAIDLGTANTLMWIRNKGIVLNEPSIVAFNRTTNHLIAVGKEAQSMLGKTHKEIAIIRPLHDGAIADFEITEGMLRAFIKKISSAWQPAKRIVVCVPSGLTEVEKRAVRDSCEHTGAKEVHLIAEPMASAIGMGINVSESEGNMVVDIGGGTTEIAVIALSGIVKVESIRIAGDEMTEAIVQYFKQQHNILVGDRTAEKIKHEVGSAVPLDEELEIEVKGRDLLSGIPKMIRTNSADIRNALADSVNRIVAAVLTLLEKTPPELSADIFEKGIMVSGGGGYLRGIDERLSKETSLPVYVAEEPHTTVIRGTGKVLENLNEYAQVLIKNARY